MMGASRHRVLVLRPDHLGDAVLFSGALKHLRTLYPESRITLAAHEAVAELLALCPYIDRLLPWHDVARARPRWLEFRGGHRVERALARLGVVLQRSADVVLVPLRSPDRDVHEVVGRIRAAKRIGIAGDLSNQRADQDRAAEAVYTSRLHLADAREERHELEVTRDFLRHLGADVPMSELAPEFWTDSADRAWAARHVRRVPGTRLVAIAPGVASLPAKQYPAASLARAIAGLPARATIVLFGGAGEVAACREAAAVLRDLPSVAAVVDLGGASTVRQLVEGLRRCDVVLSEETAALHIATALGRPTVGILGGGHAGRFYPWGDPDRNLVASHRMECFGCNWTCRFDSLRCIQGIAPEQVTAQLTRLLAPSREMAREHTGSPAA